MANLKPIRAASAEAAFNGWCDESPDSVLREFDGRPKLILYGLPCARCKAYFGAELDECPICHCKERVSPTAVRVVIHPKARAA